MTAHNRASSQQPACHFSIHRFAFSSFFIGIILSAAPFFSQAQSTDNESLRQEVAAVETAFAKTMADRDFDAFAAFVSEEAVFLNGGKPLRGKSAVLEYWKKFFVAEKPPFSWKPDLVEVLESGTLAESIGPVFNPEGKLVARFYSTWRKEEPGVWRIVFDDGYDLCEPTKP